MFEIAGYEFERTEIGGVRVSSPEGNETVFRIEDWCHIIAAVSIMGDTDEGYDEAFQFHIKAPVSK